MRVSLRKFHKGVRGIKSIAVIFVFTLLVVSCNTVYGSNVRFLNRIKGYPADHLVWSPSGRYIAVRSYGGVNQSTIYILDVQTKKLKKLWDETYGNKVPLAWSQDGYELYFGVVSSNELKNGIWLTNISTNEAPRFYNEGLGMAVYPKGLFAFSRSDENHHIFISIEKNNIQIDRIDLENAIAISFLSWDSDGKKLVFSLDKGIKRREDIYFFDLENKKLFQLTVSSVNYEPTISPNGNLIAYIKGDFSKQNPQYNLHIMNIDGTCDTELPKTLGINSPAWSPDGSSIAFVGSRNGIYILDIVTALGEDILENGLICNK